MNLEVDFMKIDLRHTVKKIVIKILSINFIIINQLNLTCLSFPMISSNSSPLSNARSMLTR